MSIEQERAEFEAWAIKERIAYRDEKRGVCFYNGERNSYWIGYQAGRAALQSQDREDAERYRTLVASGKFVPATLSPSCLWGLRTSGTKATKAELDEAIDHARRIDGESTEQSADDLFDDLEVSDEVRRQIEWENRQ